jgi:hypothetical protein
VDEPDPVGNHEAGLGTPARIVEDEKDDAPGARAGLLREGVEQRLEERLGDAIRDIPEGLAGRRRDEGGDVEPLVAVMPGGQRALSARRPDAAQHRLQADPALIGCKDFDGRVWMLGLFLGDRLAKLMEWPAPPSGDVGSPEHEKEEWALQVSVLGIDLGKNVCSIVGLDTSGMVVLRRRVGLDP